MLDGNYVASIEELELLLKSSKRSSKAQIVFIQATTSQTWEKKKINSFESALVDLFDADNANAKSEYMQEKKEMFDLVISSLGKIVNGKPDCHAYFCTTDLPPEGRKIIAAFKSLEKQLRRSGYFYDIMAEAFDHDRIVNFWQRSMGVLECTLPFVAQAAFPKSAGVDESYVVTVKAKDFVDKVLKDEFGNQRIGIFEGNVRDFLE